MVPPITDVLHDNASLPEFASLRRSRNWRVAASLIVFVSTLVLVTVMFAPDALRTGRAKRMALWLTAAALPLMLIVGGLIQESQHPLEIRVEATGVVLGRRRIVAVAHLRGARLVESEGFIAVRKPTDHRERPVLGVWKKELANPEAFRLALSRLVDAAPASTAAGFSKP